MKTIRPSRHFSGTKMARAKARRRTDFQVCSRRTPVIKTMQILMFAAFLILVATVGAWSAQSGAPQAATAPNIKVPGTMPARATPPTTPVRTGPQSLSAGQKPPCSGPSCPLTPTAAGPSGDIRDIRGPIHLPNPLTWIWGLVAGTLLLLVAWGFRRWFQKRRTLRAKRAFEIAFEALKKAKALMTPEQAEGYSVAVSGIIRTYIENRFSVKATRATTHEFMRAVAGESTGELARHGDRLRAFLTDCDLAKFARHHLTREQMEKMHESAWQFVMETMPRTEEKSAAPTPEPVSGGDPEMAETPMAPPVSKGSSRRKWNVKRPWVGKNDDTPVKLPHTHQPAAAGGQ